MDSQEVQKLENAATLIAESAAALIEATGMVVDNLSKMGMSMTPKYKKEDFEKLLVDHSLTHNGIINQKNNGL